MLDSPHVRPLQQLVAELRDELGAGYQVPNFDPLDGGTGGGVLFLLEAPGGKAVGSGFVSRDNPDPTARNMAQLLREANLPRHSTLLWNVVPWYVGSGNRIRPVSGADLKQARPWLDRLLELPPNLKVVVLVGRKAQRMQSELGKVPHVEVLTSFHPSNLSLNRLPNRRAEVLSVFRKARLLLSAT